MPPIPAIRFPLRTRFCRSLPQSVPPRKPTLRDFPPPSQTSSSRSSARIFLSRRDTPTCVNPSSFAVSACVFPRKPDFAAHSRNPFPLENPPCAFSHRPVKRVPRAIPREFSFPAATRRPALTQATSPFQPAFPRENPPCAIFLCPVKRASPAVPQEFSFPAATRQPALTQAVSPFQPAFPRERTA